MNIGAGVEVPISKDIDLTGKAKYHIVLPQGSLKPMVEFTGELISESLNKKNKSILNYSEKVNL